MALRAEQASTATNGSAGAPPAHGGPGGPVRTTGRRGALPNGRAVVGGLLVAAAAIATFAAWSGAGDGPSTRYVVAARDIAVGQVVEAGDLDEAAMDVPDAVARAAFDDTAIVVGQVAVAPLSAGDLVQRSALVVPEDDEPARQLSFPIDVSAALAGTVEVGERVDVLVTTGSDAAATTSVVAEGATVARLVGGDDGGRLVVLLSVPDGTDILALTTAARRGDLTLVRTTPGTD